MNPYLVMMTVCGIILFVPHLVAKPVPECGVKTFAKKESAACGAKVARSKACGVESYKLKANPKCGIEKEGEVFHVIDENGIRCPENSKQIGYIDQDPKCSAPKEGEVKRALSLEECLRLFICQKEPQYASCRHKSNGVAEYKACAHKSHGFKSCRLPEFGVEEYLNCATFSYEEIVTWLDVMERNLELVGNRLLRSSALMAKEAKQQRLMYCAIDKLQRIPSAQEALNEMLSLYEQTFGESLNERSFDCQQSSGEEIEPALEECIEGNLNFSCHLFAELTQAQEDLAYMRQTAETMARDIVARKNPSIAAELNSFLEKIRLYTENRT